MSIFIRVFEAANTSHRKMELSLSIILLVGVGLRIWLFRSPVMSHWLSERPELVTPLTSWKRVTEGLALRRGGMSPYDGDVYHETPLFLRMVDFADGLLGRHNMWVFLLVVDLVTALVLHRVAVEMRQHLLQYQADEQERYHSSSSKLKLTEELLAHSPLYVIAAYVLNPLTIATCAAMSTTVFHNLILSLALLFIIKGNRLLMCMFTALAAYETMYPIMLIVPAALLLADREVRDTKLPSFMVVFSVTQTLICVSSALTLLLFVSNYAENSWEFIRSTYGFLLTVSDLAPNVGIFWYFFTEVFDHFRTFFVFVFQIHAFIYLPPLTIRLRKHPLFLAYSLLALSAIFRSYPSLGDSAFCFSLLPMWRHLSIYTRNVFLSTTMFCVGIVMAPVQWYLWIYAGSANANFYFAITLVISAAEVLFVTDLLYAFVRREYDLFHGCDLKTADGKPLMIILD